MCDENVKTRRENVKIFGMHIQILLENDRATVCCPLGQITQNSFGYPQYVLSTMSGRLAAEKMCWMFMSTVASLNLRREAHARDAPLVWSGAKNIQTL